MEDKPKGKKVFSWTLWNYTLDAKEVTGATVSVQARAIDSNGKV
jgi:hypothetical protein